MAKHQDLSSPYAIHPFAYSSNADPANDGSIDTTPYKGWINTGSSNLLKVRNAADTDWEDVSVAGSGTTPAFGSNSNSVSTSNSAGAGVLSARSTHQHIGVTSLAHTSNTFSGPVTLVAGQNIGITSSVAGTFRIDGAAAGGGGSSDLAGKELDYVQFTSSVVPTATTEATANTVVTGSPVTYDGSTAIIITFECSAANPAHDAAGRSMLLWLYDGASSIGALCTLTGRDSTNPDRWPVHRERRLTPSAASHTYSIRASVTAGSDGSQAISAGAGGAGNFMPGFIRITRV